MSYYRTRHGLGFTPDEEKSLLAAAKSEQDETPKLDEILDILRRQDKLRTITTIAAVGGALYTLARLGELIAAIRGRRAEHKTLGMNL